ncbi:23S rRNA pseudouridine(2605) synthase RluB [Aquabacterium sp.]|uniref:23S rRNA pseudouridine(2605) synthase RluB n=1 Tax=Aquabacterium sp. TaxID=1872578 RepID=UPI0025C73D3F|nr:pseudouridine synthase [Aquabacterium sp.]
MQDPNESSPELDPSALNAPEDAPKPKRARRTKAAENQVEPEAEAVVEEVAKPAPRRRKAVAVAAVPEDLPPPVVEAVVAEIVETKPKRAPRKKPAPDAESAPSAQVDFVNDDSPAVREPAGDGFLQLGPDLSEPVPESAQASQEGEQVAAAGAEPRFEERGERGRRDRGPRGPRGDRPARQAPEQSGEQGAEASGELLESEGDEARDPEQLPSRRAAIAAEQANEVFAELLSGDFDTVRDEATEEEVVAAEADPQKRVLRPEPDAPKLQKVLAQSGVGSRRDIEQMIEDGRITVNGHAAHIGQRVSYGDQVKIGGKPIRIRIAPQPARILAYHKPVGEVVTHDDPQGRPTVFRRLPRLQNGKWMSVGRLDLNTEGLLLFTTSGELANQLMHPRFGVEREYAVRVLGTLPESSKNKLLEGVSIEGQMASFKSIENGGGEGVNHWYRVVITEGRNREVRKLFETVGLAVSRLIRVRYGAIVLPRGLKRGVWVELGESDVRAVKSLAGFDRPDDFHKGARQEGGRNGKPQGVGQQPAPQGQDNFRGKQGGLGPGRGQQQGNGQQGNGRGPQQGQGGYGPQGGGNQGGNQGRNNQNQNRPGRPPMDRPQGGGMQAQQGPQGEHNDDFDHIGPIPNPLEQTFDKRFATGSKRITQGFGRPDHNADRGGDPKGGPRQPDPLQTSVGYIGADAYFNKIGGRSGRGGGGQGGGGGGGNHGGGGGGRGRR